MSTVVIDPNQRVKNNWTAVEPDDVLGGVADIGDEVTVVEVESGVVGVGWVREINLDYSLIYIEVDWSSLHRPASTVSNRI